LQLGKPSVPHQVSETGPQRGSSMGHWHRAEKGRSGEMRGLVSFIHHVSPLPLGKHQWGMPKAITLALGCLV